MPTIRSFLGAAAGRNLGRVLWAAMLTVTLHPLIGAPAPAPAATGLPWWNPAGWGVPREEADFEVALAEDIQLVDGVVVSGVSRPAWDVRLQGSFGWIGVDYANSLTADPLGHPVRLHETRAGGQVLGRARLMPRLTGLASGGAYQGFTDYRSVWLNEFYRQRFSGDPGYLPADPGGWNLGAGLRWEYLPVTGFLQLDGMLQRDRVAPAFEKAPFEPLLRREDVLWTVGMKLTWETVLSRRTRMLQELSILDTTDRGLRVGWRPQLNHALADHWVLRLQAGFTLEDPDYTSMMGALTLEYDWDARTYVGVFGRYYRDNGQRNQSLPESTASPGLETVELGACVRYQGDRWGVRLSVGPYLTGYQPVGARLNVLENLYRERSWLAVRFAVGAAF